MAAIAAIGGSTNGVLHLLALAHEAGVEFGLKPWKESADLQVCFGNVAPQGIVGNRELTLDG